MSHIYLFNGTNLAIWGAPGLLHAEQDESQDTPELDVPELDVPELEDLDDLDDLDDLEDGVDR